MEEFKVGDWIKSTKFTHMRPSKVQSIYKSNERKGDFGLKCGGTVHYASEAELWQPKEGEWCWFWNNEMIKPDFARFSKLDNDKSYLAYTDGPFSEFCESDFYYYEYCEPFIGELPSILKDIK